MSESKTKQKANLFNFDANKNFQSFDQYRLVKFDQNMLDPINNSQQKQKKVNALIKGCIRRYNKSLYKGQKYYIEDLQFILDKYPSTAPLFMKNYNIILNQKQNKVNVQCHNCANFTNVWKFCSTCQDIHYCHQGCEMKIKFTHQRQQCRIKPFPKLYKPLQVQIHIGSDLGKNIQFCFQHQVSMSLLVRGQKLLDQLMLFFMTPEGNAVLDDYHVKNENRMVLLQKEIIRPQVKQGKQSLPLQNLDEIVDFYTDNKALRGLQIFLLQKGAIFCKKIRQIHNNHFREVFIFYYP